MKNYTYEWVLRDRGCVELSEAEYTEEQKDMKCFVEAMSGLIEAAKCGWSGVKYKVMVDSSGYKNPYMVLCVRDDDVRWIPIDGNSKGCNFSVLGENLW